MIAIPLDRREATTISQEYIKAPFFALLDTDTGYYKVIDNTKKSSLVVELISDHGADATVCHTFDDSVCTICEQHGMSVFELPKGSVTIDDVYMEARQHTELFT
ncbi:NifB/NifX family molybdenum-iron cluster-binding protein [Sulfurimonas sp. HSL3-7]|uniref:NifB/NifX family molybdenum-iron cluster-binding protein n=1 Tax=Sulfonitrofixus jiaomeiensis TaxID=3131938 RepID=UPI0031F865B8